MNRWLKIYVILFLAFFLLTGCEQGAETTKQELVVVSFGGSFQEAQRKAYFEPFTKETGISIREVSYDGSFEKLRAQVASGAPQWDVIDVESAVLARGTGEGLFEHLPAELTDGVEMLPGTRTDFGIGADIYATLLAYREGDTSPQSWEDFFDSQRMPGHRTMRRNPRATLEIALLSTGVDPASLYPLDVARALARLNDIRPDLRVWWTSGQQPIDLLDKGTVRMAVAWSGRVWAARRAGKAITANFKQALVETEYWVLLKGSRNENLAKRFLKFTLRADRQAHMARLFGVGPTNAAAHLEIKDPETLRWLPGTEANRNQTVTFDAEWWRDNETLIQPRWETWLHN